MGKSVVTSNGRVVLPRGLRKKYNLKKGTRVNFVDENGVIKLIPITHDFIENNAGLLKTKGRLLKALMQEKKRERR